jgi:hypothetical protein
MKEGADKVTKLLQEGGFIEESVKYIREWIYV